MWGRLQTFAGLQKPRWIIAELHNFHCTTASRDGAGSSIMTNLCTILPVLGLPRFRVVFPESYFPNTTLAPHRFVDDMLLLVYSKGGAILPNADIAALPPMPIILLCYCGIVLENIVVA